MNYSDFDGPLIWPKIRALVAAAGVEPISLGEQEGSISRKIVAAAAVFGVQISQGANGAQLYTAINAAITASGGGGAALAITGTPGAATVGAAYSFTPTISGGTAPYTVTATGLTSTGLSITNGATGLTTGTPTGPAGTLSVLYRVQDAAGTVVTMSRSIVVGAALVLRADASNADAANVIQGGAAAQYAFTRRAVHVSQHDIPAGSVIEILVPLWTFSPSGNILEVMLPEAYDFQVALEYPYFQGRTGIPTNTRTQGTIAGGATTYTSTVGGGDYFARFFITVPTTIPKGSQYGTWLTHECVAGRSGAVTGKQITMAQAASNATFERYEGATNVTTSAVQANSVMTLTSIGTANITNGPKGANMSMTVGAIKIPMPATEPSVLVNGNSIEAGNQEGYGASGTALGAPSNFGDATGDVSGNRGWACRSYAKRGIATAQLSKGSDRDQYRLLSGNYAARLAFIAALNVTHVQDMNGHNEIAGGIPQAPGWSASTAYAVDDVVFSANTNQMFICTVAGTSGTTDPSGTGTNIVGGTTLRWSYIGAYDPTNANTQTGSRAGAGWVGLRSKRLRLERTALPAGVKYIAATMIPDASSVQTATAYSYNSTTGALTLTVPDVTPFLVGARARIQGLTPTGHNADLVPVDSIDTTNKTITLTVATGLAAPTGTATANSEWVKVAGQTPNSGFTPLNSARSYINKFLRDNPNNVLGYSALADIGKVAESGSPVTIGAETGVFTPLLNNGVPVGAGPTYDNTHPTSWLYDVIATAVSNDNAITTALAVA